MNRSISKGVFVDSHLLKTVTKKLKQSKKDEIGPIRTNARSTKIIENFVGLTFEVHNGKSYIPVYVSESMVNHKLGEFVPTRKLPVHPKLNSKNKNAKKGRV